MSRPPGPSSATSYTGALEHLCQPVRDQLGKVAHPDHAPVVVAGLDPFGIRAE